MNSQNLPDIAAMRMTYLMYYVAWIYVRDSTPCLDTAVGTDMYRRRYSTHVVLNLILLISRDAIHLVFVGTLIGLLPTSILKIEGSCNTRDCWYYQPYRVDTEIAT